MTEATLGREVSLERIPLGDEGVAQAALDAGVPTAALAKSAGLPLSSSVVRVGVVADVLPWPPVALERATAAPFARGGERVVAADQQALRAGRDAVPCPPA